jgi:hypothetical protein
MDKKAELTAELRRARGWILAVGIIMFVVDTVLIQVVQKDRIPDFWRTRFLMIDLAILAYFVTLFFVAKSQPKLACILALVGYWGLQIGVAAWVGDFTALFTQGILIKIMFTAALIQGLKSANRATMLKEELEKVFG